MKFSFSEVRALASVYSAPELKGLLVDKYDLYLDDEGSVYRIYLSPRRLGKPRSGASRPLCPPAQRAANAERFVGPNATETFEDGKWKLTSGDKLREVRNPSEKRTAEGRSIHPVSKQPYSKTGRQANFQTRSTPSGRWQTNTHVDCGG
jgi:hypothetical protein